MPEEVINNYQRIYDLAEELEAVLLLEYHNKNHLRYGTNPKRSNEEMREIVREIKRRCKTE